MSDSQDIDLVDAHHRDVYAHFGLAIFVAQLLETAIINALCMFDLIPTLAGSVSDRSHFQAEWDRYYTASTEKTLGRLMKRLHEVTTVSPELRDSLSAALAKRNFLAHHFFRERSMEWITREGREDMISELQDAVGLFNAATDALDVVVIPIMTRYGITDEYLGKVLDEWKAEELAKRGADQQDSF